MNRYFATVVQGLLEGAVAAGVTFFGSLSAISGVTDASNAESLLAAAFAAGSSFFGVLAFKLGVEVRKAPGDPVS